MLIVPLLLQLTCKKKKKEFKNFKRFLITKWAHLRNDLASNEKYFSNNLSSTGL